MRGSRSIFGKNVAADIRDPRESFAKFRHCDVACSRVDAAQPSIGLFQLRCHCSNVDTVDTHDIHVARAQIAAIERRG